MCGEKNTICGCQCYDSLWGGKFSFVKATFAIFFSGFERLSLGFDNSFSILDSRSLSMWKGNQYRACLVILISKVELSDRFRFCN